MAAPVPINLPDINGCIIAGIAAGTDTIVNARYKMPVFYVNDFNLQLVLANAMRWAYETFDMDAETRGWAVTFAYSAVRYNLLAMDDVTLRPDGEWYTSATIYNDPPGVDWASYITNDRVKQAVTMMLATKVNWWLINHHVGQGHLQGYIKKVVGIYLGTETNDAFRTLLHSAGHWCSTKLIMHAAEVIEHTTVGTIFDDGTEGIGTYTNSDDLKLRLTSAPAGAHGLAVVYSGLRLLASSLVFGVYPEMNTIADLKNMHVRMMENRASYHIGAKYLTGEERATFDQDIILKHVWLVGKYVNICCRGHTLAKSPHFDDDHLSKGSVQPAEWVAVCGAFRDSRRSPQFRNVLEGQFIGVEASEVEVRAAYRALTDQTAPRAILELQARMREAQPVPQGVPAHVDPDDNEGLE